MSGPLPSSGDRRLPGLSAAEAAARTARGEVNDVPTRSSRSAGEIVRSNVFTRFNAIIGSLFVVILVVGPIQDGLFGFIIVANTGIGIVQELRAKRTLDSLAVVGEARPQVRRDGRARPIGNDEIVLGDLVELGPGDKVTVDGEVAEADGLEVDESLLTGEADPVLKHPGDAVLSGSFVTAGTGAFTATKVGRAAYAAQLAEEASRFTLVSSELRSGIDTILRYVTYLLLPTALGLVLSQLYVERHDAREAVRRMVAGIVPMVPEGLVLLTSVAFAIGVVRLGRRQCLVQELPAIEGLARVDTVCLDKTGTLTEGGMDVARIAAFSADAGAETEARGSGVRNAADVGGRGEGDGARAVPRAPGEEGGGRVREVLGALGAADPRPNASMQAVIDACPAPEGWTVVAAAPFSSARKWSGARLREPSGRESTWLLGAPDVLLPPGDPRLREVDALGAEGLRVLLLARTDAPLDVAAAAATAPAAQAPADTGGRAATGRSDDGTSTPLLGGAPGQVHRTADGGRTAAPDAAEPEAGSGAAAPGGERGAGPGAAAPEDEEGSGAGDPVAVGWVALRQRVRGDAAGTLAYFREQHVAAKVISGDNAVSVGAVAGSLGLPGADDPLDARRLPAPDRDPVGLADAVEGHSVFGRVTPQQKRDMVGALQSRGHHVAMTGDGVNDVLALKDADIGVAMGSGSEATRAVAQIVLLDDRFATLPQVVAEGRRVIGNIERVANLFLVKTVYSVLLALAVIVARVPYPFLPRHSTVVSGLTIGIPAFFLALAPNNERARPGFVRRVLRFAVPVGVIAGAASFVCYLLARGDHGTGQQADTSVTTLTLFLVALWALAIIARPYTWWRALLVLAMAGCFAGVLAIPALEDFFQLHLVGWRDPWTAVGVSLAAGVLLEIAWRFIKRPSRATRTTGPIST